MGEFFTDWATSEAHLEYWWVIFPTEEGANKLGDLGSKSPIGVTLD